MRSTARVYPLAVSGSATGPQAPVNVPLAMLIGIGTLSVFASGAVWLGTSANVADASVQPWSVINPMTAAWIVVLFWIGILCLVGSLVVAAVQVGLERMLSQAAASATPPAPGSETGADAKTGRDAAS